MAQQHYFPKKKLEKVSFMVRFAAEIPSYAARFGLTPDQVKDIKDSSAYLDYLYSYEDKLSDYHQSVTAYFNAMTKEENCPTTVFLPFHPPAAPSVDIPKPGIYTRVLRMVKAIKNHPAYTKADGEALGIEGVHPHQKDTANIVPDLRIEQSGNHVVLTVPKKDSQGYEVWVDRGTGTFSYLAFSIKRKYKDPETLPATQQTWRYKVIYYYKNEPAGLWSNVKAILV
jgi:hypothetical protein